MEEEKINLLNTEEENKAKWYVVKVHSGFEKAVVFSINQAKKTLSLEDKILDIIIPVEKQIRIKFGKRQEKENRIFPGFILVNMIMNDQTWYAINNIEHVSGFLGSRSYAESLSESEVQEIKDRMSENIVKHDVDIKVGRSVKVIEGPFSDLSGKVEELDLEKGQATVLVRMFGRDTPVKLDLFQIRTI